MQSISNPHQRQYVKSLLQPILSAALASVVLLGTSLHARSSIISPLPLPQEKILDIDEHNCSDSCLKKLYTNGYIFSFLAKFTPGTTDKKLLQYFSEAMAQLNGAEAQSLSDKAHFKVALLIPKQLVGRYSVSVANTILAYLIARNIDFDFQVFDSIDESRENIESSYLRIIQSGADFVIAMLGPVGAEHLVSYENLIYPTYIPTINKERLSPELLAKLPKNLYFGGISYKEQFETLLPFMQDMPIVEYTDDSQIGSYLSTLFASFNQPISHRRTLTSQDASQFSKTMPNEEAHFANAALILNTAAPKTGLILSQIELSEESPKAYLSTQINFNPIILQLAAPKSRENLLIVSSIGVIDPMLMEYAFLLNNDLRYDWVSYATSIGVEFGLKMITKDGRSLFGEGMQDSQIRYQNRLWTTRGSSFVLAK